MDWMTARAKSLDQNTGAYIVTNGELTTAYPTMTENQYDAANSLQSFIHDVGIPTNLKTDMQASFVGKHTEFQKVVKHKIE